MNKILQSAEIAKKMQEARDAVRKIHMVFNKDTGQKQYEDKIGIFQQAIKSCMKIKNMQPLEALLELINNENDAKFIVHLLAAAYELVNGNDFTNQK